MEEMPLHEQADNALHVTLVITATYTHLHWMTVREELYLLNCMKSLFCDRFITVRLRLSITSSR